MIQIPVDRMMWLMALAYCEFRLDTVHWGYLMGMDFDPRTDEEKAAFRITVVDGLGGTFSPTIIARGD